MRKQLLYLVGALLAIAPLIKADPFCNDTEKADSCECEITGRSYFSVRPHFSSMTPELVSGFRNDRTHMREDGSHSAFQAVLFGSKSTDSDDLVHYFTPFCKTSLIVDSRIGTAGALVEKDLLAQHFNIFTTDDTNFFRSEISFEPKQSVIGVGLHYRQSFARNDEKGRGFFWSVSSPLVRVHNEFNLVEKVINAGVIDTAADENVVSNMTEAFQQTEWKFGRIESEEDACAGIKKACDACPKSRTRLADIEVKVGMEWLDHEPCHLESYLGVVIPTGNKSTGVCIFEPIVGNGKHFGLMFGGSFGLRIWHDEEHDRELRMEYAMNSQYLFRNTQVRSFDLKNKPFSRYMEVYASKADATNAASLAAPLDTNFATPGINVFTQDVHVTPGFQYNINSALVFSCARGFQGEIGYNFYARRAECVELGGCLDGWKLGPALKHTLGQGRTNPVRDITGNVMLEDQGDFYGAITALANYENNLIQETDLDLNSAAHPCALSHTFYGALGYRWDERDYPLLANFGGSIEFAKSNNGILERWTLWGKVGVSF